MRSRMVRYSLLVAVIALGWGASMLVVGLPGGVAHAQKREAPKPQTRKGFVVSPEVFKKLEATHAAIEAEKYGEALKILGEIKGMSKLSEHERALMFQTYGYVYSSQEKYGEAAKAFESALAQNALDPTVMLNLRYNLGQLYLATEQPKKGAEILEAWFKEVENPGPDAYMALANAYVQLERYDKALPLAQTAVDRTPEPRENWLKLLLALRWERKEYPRVAELLEKLVARFPRKEYWVQLSAVYGELGKEKDSLAAYEMAHKQGFLTEPTEIVRLCELYLYHEIPYKAAVLCDKALQGKQIEANAKNLELLGNSWIQAQELDRSIEPLRRAAAMSSNGKIHLRLAQVMIEREKWNEAQQLISTALQKGGLDNPGQAHLLLGMAHFNEKEYERARQAFEQAARSQRTERAAKQWLAYVDNTLKAIR